MNCAHGSRVTRVDRAEKRARLAASNLAENDAIRPHAQGRNEEVVDGNLGFPKKPSRRDQSYRILMLNMYLRRILYQDEPLIERNLP